ITYNSPVTGPQAQAQMNTFLHSVPPQQEIVLVWAQEPQGSGKTYNYCNTSGADAFVCENKQQGAYVHNSPYDTPNVLYAQDDAGSWYLNNTSCQWITPASATGAGVDLYLVDHYENNQVDGTNVNTETGGSGGHEYTKWKNWLNCASQQNR